jgi:hypothetical protein
MDANQLLFFLRGFFEHVGEPTLAQINGLRTQILQAKPVTAEIIPVEIVNPIKRVASAGGGCGCGGGCGGAKHE